MMAIKHLPDKISDWPPEWQENYEERAGIFEYDANMSREDAELKAEKTLRENFILQRG